MSLNILKGSEKMKYYNRTNTCDICEINFKQTSSRYALREYNKEGNWTGNWLCQKCYSEKRDKKKEYRERYICNIRTCNQNPNSTNAKGDNFEDLTSRWLGVRRLSIEYDKYSMLPFDHSPIPNGVLIKIGDKLVDLSSKILQTKGRFYDSYNRYWTFCLEREWEKEFDYEICYCTNKDGKTIDRIYIIPKTEIKDKRKNISIVKNPMNSRHTSTIIPWYEEYRVKDEDTIVKINNIWKEIIRENTDKLIDVETYYGKKRDI